MSKNYDAAVIGSGPNGFSAAITLAQAGLTVILFEAKETIGGGMRSAELMLSGCLHDICSAIHPLGIGSPFFRSLPLEKHGLEWIQPLAPLAHPFDRGTPALLEQSIDETIKTLGADALAYKKLMESLVPNWNKLLPDILGPLRFPQYPLVMSHFASLAIRSADSLINRYFQEESGRGLFAGLAAHSMMPLDKTLTSAFGLVLGALGHVFGWPMPKGGSQKIANALASYFLSIGGEIVTGVNITSLDQLPPTQLILFDVGPRQLLKIAGEKFPVGYRSQLERYRYGPGVFKMDWVLNHPIPWRSSECSRAGTVHLGGTLEEIEESERLVWEKKHPEKPFVLLAQPSLFDSTRAPAGKHIVWGYCHVPKGSTFDMTARIEAQIERFAPGFGDCIECRHTISAMNMEEYNPNYVGGDINGGVQDIYQLFTRPAVRVNPYSTPVKGLYICSSSTPPGGGVHGMCGYHAANAALKELRVVA